MDYCYYNGKFSPYASMRIPLTDRSIFFGDGVYECLIGKHGFFYLIDQHIARLRSNAKILSLDFEFTDEELTSLLKHLVSCSGYEQYSAYIQLSRFGDKRQHSLFDYRRANLLIMVSEHSFDEDPFNLKLITYPDERYKMCNVKSLNLLPSVLAGQYAQNNHCDEAVFIRDGIVTECSRSNIFIVSSGTLYTHPNGRYILPGITRARLIQKAEEEGIRVIERCFGYDELTEADEVIITSSTKLARTAVSIDEKPLKKSHCSTGAMLCRRLKEDFDEICG